MALDDLAANLRLLCSYGRSVSDICRRLGINRQQVNKYLNGHAQPSLHTLRRICDFFGVDEHEILLGQQEFRHLIKLHPPKLGGEPDLFEQTIDRLVSNSPSGSPLLEQHEGYYYAYIHPDPSRAFFLRSLTRIYRQNDRWLSKTIDRQLGQHYLVPETLKYTGIALDGYNRIVVLEREWGRGQSIFTTYLYGSDYGTPTYLSGLMVSFRPEGEHGITCVRTVWEYLGRKPNLRQALSKCGLVDHSATPLPDIVHQFTANAMHSNESSFQPRT